MKYSHALFRPKILLPLAAATVIALAVPAVSAQAGAAPAAQQPACSVNPAPPTGFTEHKVQVNGIGINYVRGGHGPTLLLLHGYPQTWYSWDDILPALARHYTVVAPDLPGAGLSDAPASATDYTKEAMAADIYGLMVKLSLSHDIRIVGHDIGTMVAYSYAAAHPRDVVKLVLSEAPIPDPVIYTFPALTAGGGAVVVRPVRRNQQLARAAHRRPGKPMGHRLHPRDRGGEGRRDRVRHGGVRPFPGPDRALAGEH